VTALCSRDTRKLAGDWTGIRGNFGPAGTQMDLGDVKRYEDFHALLADPDVDLVDVCTPTHLHAPMALAALRSGKHALVEKAIALTAADADAMVAAAVDAFGRLDAVVTASGLNKVAPIVEQDPADWDEVMRANVRGSWLVCRAAGRQMLDQGGGGKVVLVSSTRGKLGHPAGYAAYCPSKAAVDLLCKTLACEWGPQRITVNAIAPTVFRSDLTAWMYAEEGRGRQVREAMLGRIPLGRLGEPEDFVGALIYLLSPASDFCTGHVLYVDGGYTAG
jgi:NAD(P)-dependent dehydrogenase (short-subunit alcohol dehydrogenase family)